MKTVFRILNIFALLTLAYFLYDLWQKSKELENKQVNQKGFSAQQETTDFREILDRLQVIENRRYTSPSQSDLEIRLKKIEEIISETFEEI